MRRKRCETQKKWCKIPRCTFFVFRISEYFCIFHDKCIAGLMSMQAHLMRNTIALYGQFCTQLYWQGNRTGQNLYYMRYRIISERSVTRFYGTSIDFPYLLVCMYAGRCFGLPSPCTTTTPTFCHVFTGICNFTYRNKETRFSLIHSSLAAVFKKNRIGKNFPIFLNVYDQGLWEIC